MYLFSLSCLVIALHVFHVTFANGLTNLAPSRPLLPDRHALRLYNKTVELIQRKDGAAPLTSFNHSIITAPHIVNKTLSSPSITLNVTEQLIKYKVPTCPTTLEFHHFGSQIPGNVFLQSMTAAIATAFEYVANGHGERNIYLGWFRYQQPFVGGGVVDFAVGDFAELGRPINYFVLCDILRGLPDYMMLPGNSFREVRFEVEVKGIGYAGSGHITWTAPASPTGISVA